MNNKSKIRCESNKNLEKKQTKHTKRKRELSISHLTLQPSMTKNLAELKTL